VSILSREDLCGLAILSREDLAVVEPGLNGREGGPPFAKGTFPPEKGNVSPKKGNVSPQRGDVSKGLWNVPPSF